MPKVRKPAEVITTPQIISRVKSLGVDSVIVGFSGGKDALTTLDICCKNFSRVEAYFLYMVEGLSFQETYLDAISRRYATAAGPLKIHRFPNPPLLDWIRDNRFRLPNQRSQNIRRVKLADIWLSLRKKTGIEWIATGEKSIDSVERNAMIRNQKGCAEGWRRFWPIGYWNNSMVFNYIKTHGLTLPPDYRFGENSGAHGVRSFGSLGPVELSFIRERYPEDFRKIVAMFPLIEMVLKG